VLRGLEPDVVAVQEANDPVALGALADELGMLAHRGEGNSAFAVAWLSREPAHARNHRLPVLEKTLLELEWRGLHLFCTHLSAGRTLEDEPRRLDEARAILEVASGGDVLVGDFNAVHPDDEIGSPPPQERLEHVSRRPIGLVLESGMLDAYRTLNDERGWTYESTHPWARFDYVFVGTRLRATQCRLAVEATAASDHLPVFAELVSRT
jgi:endonuclease/exonuclease/phosphatase family metal-dependent hydrolase